MFGIHYAYHKRKTVRRSTTTTDEFVGVTHRFCYGCNKLGEEDGIKADWLAYFT